MLGHENFHQLTPVEIPNDQELQFYKSAASVDKHCVAVAWSPDGDEVFVANTNAPDRALQQFTVDEWAVFLGAVRSGAMDRPPTM